MNHIVTMDHRYTALSMFSSRLSENLFDQSRCTSNLGVKCSGEWFVFSLPCIALNIEGKGDDCTASAILLGE